MASDWAVFTSIGIMVLSLCVLIFYLVPLQIQEVLRPKDWLTGLRWRLLLASSFITIAAAPVLLNRYLISIGIRSTLLSNVSILASACCFMAFSISFVLIYKYKKKE